MYYRGACARQACLGWQRLPFQLLPSDRWGLVNALLLVSFQYCIRRRCNRAFLILFMIFLPCLVIECVGPLASSYSLENLSLNMDRILRFFMDSHR
ncbi:hypothetical protein QWZ16_21425 [Vibrio ostreicida]|uniref:Uncharacterized protein n=1 Tax=Vibrio ostreicida TaxID=526588 RepID=A0ABT8BZN1_9VIBR|nr:hypothetical protein [Vibrio ostreicida]MDN3612159.1 hypothetical protein [Vibrio ostreicida]